ncbi:MAG: DnaD domain protein [Clostridiales bacterium]|nr:DnaD domain protein [Candidatus Cacconaster stercorequi]
MAGYIIRGAERDVILRPAEVDRLLQSRNGDAALLYLCLHRTDRGVTPTELMERLGWSELKLSAAETALQQMGLLDTPARDVPAPAEERATYTAEEVAEMLQTDADFRMLVPQIDKKLGKKLNGKDLQMLAGLYDDLGLPADVIFLLVSHCVERSEKRYGPGRRPTMRQIEKEGYNWASQGIFNQELATNYLKSWSDKQERMSHYMQVLGLSGRRPVASEQRYITAWIDKGFAPEAVALAYDKTVFYKKELNWRYLNGILRRWDEQGWHTAEEVERGESRKTAPNTKQDKQNAQIDKYMKW